MTKKSRQKIEYLEDKKDFKIKKKTFFIIFKGLSLKQIKQIFLEGKSPTLNHHTEVILTENIQSL